MHQNNLQEVATICQQTSGWRENLNFKNQTRKKRRLRARERSILSQYNKVIRFTFPRMLYIFLICLPSLLIGLWDLALPSEGQLVVDHPKNRHNNYNSFEASPQRRPNNYQPPIVPPYAIFNGSELSREPNSNLRRFSELNETRLPSSREKQNELLRKLSSTMLLESLLRHPFPINKAPFPPLSMTTSLLQNQQQVSKSSIDKFENRPYENTTHSNSKPKQRKLPGRRRTPPDQSVSTAASVIDVATTNLTKLNDADKLMPYNESNASTEIFNASALNYLVDKLLSARPIDLMKNKTSRKRPARQKLKNNSDADFVDTLSNSKLPILTLDMLIKDEYDSRIKPMMKSLTEQQKLSRFQNLVKPTTTSLTPSNHKLDDSIESRDTTTTMKPKVNITEAPSLDILTTASGFDTRPNPLSKVNTLVSFEDLADLEESEEDYQDNHKNQMSLDAGLRPNKESNVTSTTRKVLQNVPPYQFVNNNNRLQINRASSPAISVRSRFEGQSTTNDPVTLESSDNLSKSPSEKSTEASIRGSLVFSDGGYEAERAKMDKIRLSLGEKIGFGTRSGKNNMTNQIPTSSPQPAATRPDEINSALDRTDSFLLEQLLSTVNPLTELDYKLKGHYNKPNMSAYNPLIYKGYVGKDDYLFSSTARDWSKPINSREPTTTDLYNYPFVPSTTPSPPTEPPSVPYNYFLHQPVTNAQSVPSMVVPTSGPFYDTTTQSPLLSTRGDRRKNILQSPYIGPIHHHHHSNQDYQEDISNNKKYSYQLPERHNKSKVNQNRSRLNLDIISLKPILDDSYEDQRKNDSNGQIPKTNWTPSKVYDGLDDSQQHNNQSKRRQQQPANGIKTVNLNPSSSRGNSMTTNSHYVKPNQTRRKVTVPDLSYIENGSDESNSNETSYGDNSNQREQAGSSGRNSTRLGADSSGSNKSFLSRGNKPKTSSFPPDKPDLSGGTDGSLGEEDNEQVDDEKNENLSQVPHRKVKKPFSDGSDFIDLKMKKVEADTEVPDQQSVTDEEDSSLNNSAIIPPRKNNISRVRPFMANNRTINGDQMNRYQPRNRTKATFPITHEPAGSEISYSGLDKNLAFTKDFKQQKAFNTTTESPPRQKQLPKIVLETKFSDLGDNIPSTVSPTTQNSAPTSFSSTAIPNTNFFGEASSENPTLYNSIDNMNLGNIEKTLLSTQPSSEDPYQRIISSTNNILSAIQQPPLLPTLAPKLPNNPSTNINQDESSSSSVSASGPGPVKPNSSRGSSDKLYLILIGGSFALSVVCLVVAVMSMRCQDMCDDYRSLRNAERAALKLQKHRLKYTKNHQINRLNHQAGNSDIGQSLIDDLNNGSSIEAELNNMRNMKCANSGDNNKNLHDSSLWNSSNNFQPQFAGFVNKDMQSCRCGNCLNHRWLCQDNVIAANKNMSYMNPQYFMQNEARMRPLFGAASSVGTFFPRRVDDQTAGGCHGGGSGDAQILIDSQPTHSCVVNDPHRIITRTKSILHKRKDHSRNEVAPCDLMPANYGCNNPDHNHHIHHLCHNHHHRLEPSTSEESEVTIGESVLCDNNRCSNHQNNRLKVRPKGQHSHQTTAWKLGSAVKNSQHQFQHHNNSHNHHHQHISSSDSGSIAQCTCSRDQQPLIVSSRHQNLEKASHKHQSKQDSRTSAKQQARRDKSMLIWSTNRDRLI